MLNTKFRYGIDHLGGTNEEKESENEKKITSKSLRRESSILKLKREYIKGYIKALHDEGKTFLQIAEKLDIPESAVRSYLK